MFVLGYANSQSLFANSSGCKHCHLNYLHKRAYFAICYFPSFFPRVLNTLYDKLWKLATVLIMVIQRFCWLDIKLNTVVTSCHSYRAQKFVSETENMWSHGLMWARFSAVMRFCKKNIWQPVAQNGWKTSLNLMRAMNS